ATPAVGVGDRGAEGEGEPVSVGEVFDEDLPEQATRAAVDTRTKSRRKKRRFRLTLCMVPHEPSAVSDRPSAASATLSLALSASRPTLILRQAVRHQAFVIQHQAEEGQKAKITKRTPPRIAVSR